MKHTLGEILLVICCALPCGVFAQSVVVLDANTASGFQGATIVETAQSGQRIELEVIGRNIEGVNGFSAQITYDANQLSFDSFASGNAIDGFTGLKIEGGNGTVDVGGASVRGAARTSVGRLGIVRFRVLDGFAGDATVALGQVTVSVGDASQASDLPSQVTIAPVGGDALVLDADLTPGHQGGRTVLGAQAGDVVEVEVYGRNITGASGFSATLGYDSAQLAFAGFSATELIPGFTGLKTLPAAGTVEVGGASVSGVAKAGSGRLGTARFEVLSGFAGEADIRLVQGRWTVGTDILSFDSSLAISITGAVGQVVKTSDFDGSGKVDFPDFLRFAAGFSKNWVMTALMIAWI